MIRLLTAVLLFASFNVVADTEVPNTFTDGTPAKASEVNANFDALENAVDALPTPPSTCETNQIIKWNGSAWVCATDPFANLSCIAGDTLTYDGTAFTCGCVPPGPAITDSNFDAAITDWFAVGDSSGYGPISQWCTGNVTNMGGAFNDRATFNADISNWDTSKVTNMSSMFYDAITFNQDIGGWDTSNVTDMSYMFSNAYAFNQYIGGWDTSNVEYMVAMFYGATSFNQPIDSWDTGNVTTMDAMFFDAYRFNADISGWDTSNVTTMSYVFFNAITFNQDIGSWDTSKVGDMRFMFKQAISFNQDLSSWNASFVENCDSFADEATAWLDAYDPDAFFPSIAGKTPPLSPSLIAAGCGD